VSNGEGSQPDCVLALEGPLDIATTTEAHKRLIALELPRRGRLVVDLRDVTFMDSTGIRLLLHAREHARRCGAAFVIVRGPDEVMRVLALVGLDEQLDIVAPDEPVTTAAR
jgi:anti-anti-sigma factor